MEEQIIEFVRNHPVLYVGGYKKRKLKERKWVELATTVGKPVDRVKKRWKTIRDRYYRILKEHKSETTSGSGASEKYKYFDMLSFLKEAKHSNGSTADNFPSEEGTPGDCHLIAMETKPTPRLISSKSHSENNVCKEKLQGLQAINSIKNHEQKESAIMMFMKSIAVQVEAANFPLEALLNLQSNILTLVKNEIAARNVTYQVEYI